MFLVGNDQLRFEWSGGLVGAKQPGDNSARWVSQVGERCRLIVTATVRDHDGGDVLVCNPVLVIEVRTDEGLNDALVETIEALRVPVPRFAFSDGSHTFSLLECAEIVHTGWLRSVGGEPRD